jgi:glycosyltransferase involved in cell wall biosynthesis
MSVAKEDVMPLVTVITVVRNGATHLERTIRSVLDCAYRNLAFIIVDGASTDGTVELINKYEHLLTWWVSEPDNGIYDAMNKGWVAAASESYVLFLGSGDCIISLPSNPDDYSTGYVLYGDVQLGERLFQGKAGFGLRCNNTLHHQSLLVHKSLHPEPPFDIRFRVYADFDFNQRLLKHGAQFKYCCDLQSSALPGGLSSSKAHRETLQIVAKNFGPVWALVAVCWMALNRVWHLINRLGAVS